MVICLERDADLHMALLMLLPLTVSCFSKIQIGFTFLYRLTRVVPEKGPLNGCVCVCVCVCVLTHVRTLFCRTRTYGSSCNATYEWLVLGPAGLYDDDGNATVVSGLDDESVVRRRVLEPRTHLASNLELVPRARRARPQVDRPASNHLPHLPNHRQLTRVEN